MAISHAMASGMSGVRAAGDLVARMQMTRGMKIGKAKEYVSARLGVSIMDLTDEVVMNEVRRDLNIGMVSSVAGFAKGMEAKFNISRLLDVKINCLERLTSRKA